MDSARADSLPDVRWLRVGRITGLHGLAGGMRLKLDNPESPTFAALERVQLIADAAPARTFQVRQARPLNHGAVKITLEGIEDPSAAEALKGAVVFVDATDLPPAEGNEFYYFEVIGCAVRTTDGRDLGRITEVFATGANDVWIVRDGATEVLVPVIADIVKSMDLAARSVLIEAVPGLLD